MERIVLITNLLDVSMDTGFGKMRTHTNALVLIDRGPDDKTGTRYRAHGFCNEVGNPTFDMALPSFDWSIESKSFRRAFVLCFAGEPGPRIELAADFTNDAPLDIERWDRPDGTQDVWGDVLVRKVLRYYYAPYIMLGRQFTAESARKTFGVERISQ
jgi:hypothetical protein